MLLVAGCGVFGSSSSNSNLKVLQAVMSTGINDQQQATGSVTNAFPANIQNVYAVIVLQGVGAGDNVDGKWYRLNPRDPETCQLLTDKVTPDGYLVSENGVVLAKSNITPDGAARVALSLSSTAGAGALPVGDWALRVYANGKFIRTVGFVITDELGGSPSLCLAGSTGSSGATGPSGVTSATGPTGVTGASGPPPTITPAPTATPTVQTYTVAPGDSLTVIANKFKPASESTEFYINRLSALNNLQVGAILAVGQVLKLPGPQ